MIEQVGKRIKGLLEDSDKKQKELAEYLGVSEVTVSRYVNENHIPQPDLLLKIADFLNTTVDYLLGRTPVNTNTTNTTSPDSELPENWQEILGFIRRSGSKHLTDEEKSDLLTLGEMFARKIERRIKEEGINAATLNQLKHSDE